MKSMNRLTRWLAVGVLALVATTWKLWTPQDVFPQIPLLRAACDWPGWFDWVCLAVLVASSLTLLCVARRGWVGRSCCAALAASLLGFFVLDQHRLQPWAWQFFLLAVLLSLADDTTARRGWRWLVIGIYFWSAVSKLDITFFHEQGPALLGGLKQAMGLRGMPNKWTEALDVCGSVGIALGEMGVAVLLAWPRARWLGLWVTTILHLTLLAALGPLGLNHSLGVLLWNVFFLVQNWLLFRATTAEQPFAGETFAVQLSQWWRDLATWPATRTNRLALGTVLAAMTWPVLEPFGYCDHWLAWAVYSSRAERVWFVVIGPKWTLPSNGNHGDLRNHVKVIPDNHGYFRELNLSNWSLDAISVPCYPQERFQLGVVSAVCRVGDIEQAFGDITQAPHRIHGGSDSQCFYLKSLQAELDRFTINAHPRLTTYGATPK